MAETPEQAVQSSPPARRLRIRAAQISDVGLVRTENQDFAVLTSPDEERQSKLTGRLMLVADGMGGHRGGATASRIAAQTVKDEVLAGDSGQPGASLVRALERANSRVFAEAQQNPDLRGMGTTCSAILTHEGRGYLAHIGDSRVYLIRDAAIQQLTEDHSLVASMVREGLLSQKEAEIHPRKNILQRSMGVTERVEIDVPDPVELRPGDAFILCSDGLHGVVSREEMLEISSLDVDQAARELVNRAIDRGAPDNVTVIVAKVEEEPPAESAVARGARLFKWILFFAAVTAAAVAAYWLLAPPVSG